MWGKSLVDESSPSFLGIYSGSGSPESVRRGIEEAPVLVTAGVQFTDLVSGFFSQRIDTARSIDIGPYQSTVAGKVFAPLDMRAALQALTAILQRRDVHSPEPAAPPTPAPVSPPAPTEPLTQKSLWDSVAAALTPGNIVLADQGTSFYGMAEHRLPSGVTFIGQPLWASIGYTLPATLGAGLAHPDRRPVLLIGDGAAQLTVQELGCLARENIPAVIVLVNNDGYTIERAIHGEHAYYNDIVSWKWLDLLGALGAHDHLAFRAENQAELDDALMTTAAHREKMVIIEAIVPRLDLPPVLADLAHSAAAANSGPAGD